jgi:hypothetical protein
VERVRKRVLSYEFQAQDLGHLPQIGFHPGNLPKHILAAEGLLEKPFGFRSAPRDFPKTALELSP